MESSTITCSKITNKITIATQPESSIMPQNKVFVNRTLNLKRIKYIGLDMDHTLVRYNTENFERLSHSKIMEKLVAGKSYPEQIKKLQFK